MVKCQWIFLHEVLYSEHSRLGRGPERVFGAHSITFRLGEVYFSSRTAESDHLYSVIQLCSPGRRRTTSDLQSEPDDPVHNLYLSEQQTELLGSGLLQWDLLSREARTSLLRKRQGPVFGWYKMHDCHCICSDINGLMEELGFLKYRKECRTFVDLSKLS